MPAFLQVATRLCWLFSLLSLWTLPSARAGQPLSMTERQEGILKELQTFRPAWVAGGDEVWMLSIWDSDAGLGNIVALPSGGGNAAASFRLLEDYYPAEASDLERGGADTRGVDALLEAAEAGECRFIPDYYPEFVSTEVKQPDFQIMRLYLQGLLRRAERSAQKGDNRDAERCYRAALLCGWHLTQDKSSSIIYVTGLIFKVRGSQAYANHLIRIGDSARADAVKRYAEVLAIVMRAFMWKANVALSEFDGFACLPAVIRIAREDAEVFWRKEAVVRLATLRYGVPDEKGVLVKRNPAYELAADEALAEAASSDADGGVRRMAIWAALHINPDNYAGMRHEF